jgi:uncharacterized protein (DUF2235 family)
MPKQIALFLDGTRNTDNPFGGIGTSSVHKLYRMTYGLKRYIKGVAADSNDPIEALTGLGTTRKIREAYRFLTHNYVRGDSIFIFGFSRGAFAARSLAGFAFRVGLLLDGNDTPTNLDAAWKAYTKPSPTALRELQKLLYKISGHSTPTTERSDLPVHFIGVWDTVSALGGPFKYLPLVARFGLFHRHELPPNVNHGRHALAFHEGRRLFEPLLFSKMTDPQRQTLEQRWFSGAHADVGGGYREPEAGLAQPAFRWMAGEAVGVGFTCNGSAVAQAYVNGSSTIHQEMNVPFIQHRIRPALEQPYGLLDTTRQSFSIDPSVPVLMPSLASQYPQWARPRLLLTDALIQERISQAPLWG